MCIVKSVAFVTNLNMRGFQGAFQKARVTVCVFLHETHFTEDAAFRKMQWGETVLFSHMAPVDQQVSSNA